MKAVNLTSHRWDRWRTHDPTAATIRALRKQYRLEGRKLTKADLLRMGLRPKRDDKIDEWKALTDSKRRTILERSRKHSEFQLALGIPKDTIYGPWPVLEGWSTWTETLTSSTVGSTEND